MAAYVTMDTTMRSGVFYAVIAKGLQAGRSLELTADPCGGGVEYLHRDPASRRRRRKGKSQN
jgi:hypothetical protein